MCCLKGPFALGKTLSLGGFSPLDVFWDGRVLDVFADRLTSKIPSASKHAKMRSISFTRVKRMPDIWRTFRYGYVPISIERVFPITLLICAFTWAGCACTENEFFTLNLRLSLECCNWALSNPKSQCERCGSSMGWRSDAKVFRTFIDFYVVEA